VISKCNNIFVVADLDAKFGDFSGSHLSTTQIRWSYTGTPPVTNTLNTRKATVKTEIFVLGSTFYHILKGHAPYKWMDPGLASRKNEYPEVISMGDMGNIIMSCWHMKFDTVDDCLMHT
jgi:hypothetical protein